jgi:hypothetical protein
MTPKTLSDRTRRFTSPTDWERGECGSLDIIDMEHAGLPIMYSAWEPTMEELSILLQGGTLWLGVFGTTHPVVTMLVSEPVEATKS